MCSATSFEMNPDRKTAITTPPLAGTSRRMSSGTLRGWSVTARAPECEKITGASVTSSAARIVPGETWLRSTSIPSRFISRTTSQSERREPVVLRVIGGRVGPAGRLPMGQRHVAHAEGVELAERGQRARDHRAALEPDQRRDPPGGEGALDLVGGRRKGERLGICRHEARDDVELLDGHPEGLELGQGRRHPDRPELAPDATLAQARDVGVETVDVAAQVDARGPQAADPLAKRDRQVVVAVDQRRIPQDRAGALGEPVVGRGHAGVS